MKEYAKAIVSGFIATLTALAVSLNDGTITAQDWLYALIAGLVSLSAVWAVPNRTP